MIENLDMQTVFAVLLFTASFAAALELNEWYRTRKPKRRRPYRD